MFFSRRKFGVVLSIAALSSTVFAGAAFAEGQWESSISGALPGFTSRAWQDNASDSSDTVTYFQGCSLRYSNLKSIDLGLWDKMGLFPDYRSGGVNQNCGTYNFGRMTRPNEYYFKVERLNDQYVSNYYLDVSYVKQSY